MGKWLKLEAGEPLLQGHSMWEIYQKRYLLNVSSFDINDLINFVTEVTESRDFIAVDEENLYLTIYACDPKQWSGRKMSKMRKQLGLKGLCSRSVSEVPSDTVVRIFTLEAGQRWRIKFTPTSANEVCHLWGPILQGYVAFINADEGRYFEQVFAKEKFEKGRNYFDIEVKSPQEFFRFLDYMQKGFGVQADYLP